MVVEGNNLDLEGRRVVMVVMVVMLLVVMLSILVMLDIEAGCTPSPRPKAALHHLGRGVALVLVIIVRLHLLEVSVFAMLVLRNIALVLVMVLVVMPGLPERDVNLDIVPGGLARRDDDLPNDRTAREDLDLVRRRCEVVGELLRAVSTVEERVVEGDPLRRETSPECTVRMGICFD